MHNTDEKTAWEAYKKCELSGILPVLTQAGYETDISQPHTGGERHLTRPLDSGYKLLLLGRRVSDGKRVIIKTSSEPLGVAEIEHERTCREVLNKISFAYQTFLAPHELLFIQKDGYTILITEFIEQEKSFLERTIEEQFALALKAFKAQESAHATTSSHVKAIKHTFGEMRSTDYLNKFENYVRETQPHVSLDVAYDFLCANAETIEQYCGFLTHWDFMPQNIRIVGEHIYLLDHSSIRFGNKYEGWARFINFMELYNPPLVRALLQYVSDNRTPEESLALKCMRVYRLGELIRYYTGWLTRTDGNLYQLALARIAFWGEILNAVLADQPVPPTIIGHYRYTRDSLRSEDEKKRQVGLH